MILSIITVVKDDLDGLLKTCSSIDEFVLGGGFEHIIWWNSSQSLENNKIPQKKYRQTYLGNDTGIFDAMNKSLQKCKGQFVLFLNARDTFESVLYLDDLKNNPQPSLIKVKYKNYFGSEKFVSVKKNTKMGIPFCHQGMLLERLKVHFPTDKKFSGDYVAFLDCKYEWPLKFLESGLIRYDTEGVSSINRWSSDMHTNAIIGSRFGIFWRLFHLLRSVSKVIVKKLYKIRKK
ncbi:hypothetical protein N9Q00_00395 [Amylibacter sp.]|nr:hypothetical protein [Amylibacter sp.]MDB9785460.1 hypothetical protein [Amylibacter sp.]